MNYQKIYDSICIKAKNQLSERLEKKAAGEYFEGHHILPKCLGGEGKSKNWHHSNIAPLTSREHFICHWLLTKIYPDVKLLGIAFWSMCYNLNNNHKRDFIPSSKMVEYAKLKMIEGIKGRRSGRLGKPPWNKGLVLNDDKYKIGGKKNLGRKHTTESKQIMKNKLIGNNRSCKKIIDINTSTVYDSITNAAKQLKIGRHQIYHYIKQGTFKYA